MTKDYKMDELIPLSQMVKNLNFIFGTGILFWVAPHIKEYVEFTKLLCACVLFYIFLQYL